jgi:hypothetical protein
MGIRGLPPAYEAGLLGDVSDMLAVPNPAWLGERQYALIDLFCCPLHRLAIWPGAPRFGFLDLRKPVGVMDRKAQQLGLEALLDMPRVNVGQSALFWKRALRPERGRIGAANVVELGEEPIA